MRVPRGDVLCPPIMARNREFTRGNPCPICGRTSRCNVTADGLHLCKGDPANDGNHDAEWTYFGTDKKSSSWGLYRPIGDVSGHPRRPALDAAELQRISNEERWHDFQQWKAGPGRDATPILNKRACYERLRLMLPRFDPAAFDQLDIVFIPGSSTENPLTRAFGFPEVNGAGEVVGYTFRYPNGFKQQAGRRGIIVPHRLRKLTLDDRAPRRFDRPAPLFVVEGASDVLAMCQMGLDAIGRPNNVAGPRTWPSGSRSTSPSGVATSSSWARTTARRTAVPRPRRGPPRQPAAGQHPRHHRPLGDAADGHEGRSGVVRGRGREEGPDGSRLRLPVQRRRLAGDAPRLPRPRPAALHAALGPRWRGPAG
jgi:hypothetical protein